MLAHAAGRVVDCQKTFRSLVMSKSVKSKLPEEEKKAIEVPEGTPAEDIRGRAVFAVDTSAAGIVIRTAFLSEQGQLMEMPAVFPI